MRQFTWLLAGVGLCLIGTSLFSMVGMARSAATATPVAAPAAAPADLHVDGLAFETIKMRDGRPGPQIPADWRLVTVTPPDASLQTHLWFQDRRGNVFLVFGTYDKGHLVVDAIPVVRVPAVP